jgi:hypothetical protein
LSKQYSSRDLPSHNKLKRRFVSIKLSFASVVCLGLYLSGSTIESIDEP